MKPGCPSLTASPSPPGGDAVLAEYDVRSRHHQDPEGWTTGASTSRATRASATPATAFAALTSTADPAAEE